jgi:hypothetical protein
MALPSETIIVRIAQRKIGLPKKHAGFARPDGTASDVFLKEKT